MQDSYIRRQELKVADKEPDCHCGKLSFRAPIGCRLPGALVHTVLILILFFFLASCFVLEDRDFSLNKTITSYDLGYWAKNGVLLFFVCVYARQGWKRELLNVTWRSSRKHTVPSIHSSCPRGRKNTHTPHWQKTSAACVLCGVCIGNRRRRVVECFDFDLLRCFANKKKSHATPSFPKSPHSRCDLLSYFWW